MPTTPQQSNTPSSVQSSATRRSARLPRASVESDKPSPGPGNSQRVSMMSTATNEPEASEATSKTENPTPWRHPDELPYICREDWSQDLMLAYLAQNAFSVPARGNNTSIPLIQITCRDGSIVSLPRAYRIPLMFVAKFQWESLRLVLNATDPSAEWQEYKFDIIHVSRLCHHLFRQAKAAAPLEKAWRSKMFDRVLTRFYHKWLVNREWSLRNFWFEFAEEEYAIDVLRYDWGRWSLKGLKGFVLTKEEIQNGITFDQYMDGLAKDENGVWKMTPSPAPISIEVKRERIQALIPSNTELSLVDQFAGITNAGPSTANSKKRPRDDGGSVQQSKKKRTEPMTGPQVDLNQMARPPTKGGRRKITTSESTVTPNGKTKNRPLSSAAILAFARPLTTSADKPVSAGRTGTHQSPNVPPPSEPTSDANVPPTKERASPLMEKITAVARQLTGDKEAHVTAPSQSPPIPQQNGDASSAQGLNERRPSPLSFPKVALTENQAGATGDAQTMESTDDVNGSSATPDVCTPASEASSSAAKEAENGKAQEIITPETTPVVDRPPPLARLSSSTDTAAKVSINAAVVTLPVKNASSPAGEASADATNSFERPTPPLRPKTTTPSPGPPTSPTMANLIQSSSKTSPSTPQQANGTAKTAPGGDQMDVDDSNPPNEDGPSEPSVGQLVVQAGTRGKTLHTVLLLRDLLRFLRYPGGEEEQETSTTSTVAPGRYPSALEARARYAALAGEEPMTVDQRLDVLAHASVALAKVLYPYRGKELEIRIDSLDHRLQQQFERLWKLGEHPIKEKVPELHARILDEKEVQTLEISSSSQATQTIEEVKVVEPVKPPPSMTSQGVQAAEEERILEVTGIQTEPVLAAEPPPPPSEPESPMRLLSPDATMVDISQPPTEGDVTVSSSKPLPLEDEDLRRRPPVSGAVASIMRSMADLLESASRDTSGVARSAKGKERELDVRDVEMGDGYADSPILAALMNELKSMKDELRENQQRSREEIVAMRMLHRSEVDTLKNQMQEKEHQGREELEEIRRRHGEELEQVRDTIHTLRDLKEKQETVEEGPSMPPMEILELSRRITTLETRSRTESFTDSNSPAPQSSPATIRTSEPPTTMQRLSNSHPLAHLLPCDPGESSVLPSPRTGRSFFTEFAASKPGTPASSDRPSISTRPLDGMEVEESIPLPIKTQRKMYNMMFQRPPG
ncbi:hypothetical protein M413DRAFT_448264 [Hebeloma cylindrosporum]|uniref:Uncharacterized protein n=1 Tax=Hebeloma cylindrosporum TaxID=76867 RepID=A0A0C2XIV9_HEBCY|nr:hypothetical protein M413DRAFT_448264 [Hebeloma cylindrosporum h7]